MDPPRPVIVITRDNRNYSRVLVFSHDTTTVLQGRGVFISSTVLQTAACCPTAAVKQGMEGMRNARPPD